MRANVRRSLREARRLTRSRWQDAHPWRSRLLDFLFPPSCAVCGRDGAPLCDDCRAEMQPAAAPRCRICWAPRRGSPCADCLSQRPPFDGLRASFVYDGTARTAILALKYNGIRSVATPLLDAITADVVPRDWAIDVVTAVPMPDRRRRRRGYNQAEVLGRLVAAGVDRPFEPRLLERARAGGQQAAQGDREARLANVRDAFRASRDLVAGRRVLVVDDVTTSGATLAACARALRSAGAENVHVWALARED